MRVVGLDISLTNTGVAELDPLQTKLYRVSSKPCPDDVRSRWDRFNGMIDSLPVIERGDLVVVEQPAFSRTTGKHHDRSGLWWFVVDFALQCGGLVTEVPPSTLKKYVTGKGNASKTEMMAAQIKRYPSLTIHDDNEADALALAAMGARHLGHPVDGELPKVNLAAMQAVKWSG